MSKRDPYVVRVNPPAAFSTLRWDYPIGYFPRKFYYLKDAKACAQRACERGASIAFVDYPGGRACTHTFFPITKS